MHGNYGHFTRDDFLYAIVFILAAYSLYIGLSVRGFKKRLREETFRRRFADDQAAEAHRRVDRYAISLGLVRNVLEDDGYTLSQMSMCGGCGLMKSEVQMNACKVLTGGGKDCPSFQKTFHDPLS